MTKKTMLFAVLAAVIVLGLVSGVVLKGQKVAAQDATAEATEAVVATEEAGTTGEAEPAVETTAVPTDAPAATTDDDEDDDEDDEDDNTTLLLVVLGVILVAVIAGGIIWYRNSQAAGTPPGTTRR